MPSTRSRVQTTLLPRVCDKDDDADDMEDWLSAPGAAGDGRLDSAIALHPFPECGVLANSTVPSMRRCFHTAA
jgi:hypothetical protein